MSHDRSTFFVSGQLLSRINFGGMLSLLALVLLALGGPEARADWPEFRGPWGDGHASAPGDAKLVGLPLHWSETNNIKWKTEIPYRGWSTPVVMGGQVWLTTATDDGHDFFAICVDADSGKIRFNEKVFHSDNPEPLGNGASMNCYATPSPVIEPGRVYVHFGSFGTACLDTSTGKALWKRDDLRCRHYRGPSSSLISFENLLILTFDGADQIGDGVPGHEHRESALEKGRPALPSLSRAVIVPHLVREPADLNVRRRRSTISCGAGQTDRQDCLEN